MRSVLLDKDIWQEIIASLKSNKLRTLLTALGVIWGMFMLMVLLGAGSGFENHTRKEWAKFSTNSMFINAKPTTVPYKGYPRGRRFRFTNEDCEIIKSQFSGIKYFSGGVYVSGGFGSRKSNNVLVRGKHSGAYAVQGVEPDQIKIDPLNMLKGRFINDHDVKHKRKVCVIGMKVYKALFPEGGNPVGEYIKINNVFFQIIGYYTSYHSGGWANWQNGLVWMPRNTAQQTFNLGDKVYWYAICAHDSVSVSSMKDGIISLMSERHSVSPDDKMAFKVNNIEQRFKEITDMFNGINIFTWVVGIFTLIAGIIGISNIMLISIKERTKEIGIRRALGAKPLTIITHIIAESTVLTFIAGYAGMFLGIIAVEVSAYFIEQSENNFIYNPEISFNIAILSLLIIVFAGIMAGFIPSLRAIKIKPVEAIRD